MKKLWTLIVKDERFPYFVACLVLYGLMAYVASMMERGASGKKILVFMGAFALIGSVLLGAQILWAVLSWASVWDTETSSEEKRIKKWMLVAGLVMPLLLVARPEMDFQAILESVTHVYFIAVMAFVGYVARAFAKTRQFPRLKTYVIVYAAVVVFMGLASLGVFRSADDEYGYIEEESEIASPLTTRERLLRNIIFYSIAGFVGVYSTRREHDPI